MPTQHGKGYPPALDENLQLFVVDCPRDVVALLGDGAVRPRDITTVIYSHLHFDHIGDLTPFAFAELFVGAAAEEFINDSYPSNPDGFFPELPPAQKVRYVHFDAAQPPARILAPLGSFARGLDLFGDGSLYLLDAPGHFPGHLAALVRVAPEQFVLLAADCCHNRLCYSPGERLISSENYLDIEVARETVQKLKQMDAADNVVVVLAHEKERLGEMPLFPIALNDWATEQAGQKNLGLYALTKK